MRGIIVCLSPMLVPWKKTVGVQRASLERHFIFLLKCSCHRQSGVGSAHFHSLYLLFVSKQGIFWL